MLQVRYMSTKTEFASKIGLIAATVGSAIGLGNIWRFPAIIIFDRRSMPFCTPPRSMAIFSIIIKKVKISGGMSVDI